MPELTTIDEAERAIVTLLNERDAGKTICPSEAARRLQPDDWRPLMPAVRDAAARLIASGTIEVTQRGEVVDLAAAKGPIRLRMADEKAADQRR